MTKGGATWKIGVFLLIGSIGSALIISKPWVTIQHAKPITVKGYADCLVQSDRGGLTIRVEERNSSRSSAYIQLAKSTEVIKNMIVFTLDKEVEILDLGVQFSETQKLNNQGKRTNEVENYRVSKKIRIDTSNVEDLNKLTATLLDLNAQGYVLALDGPEFFVSELEKIKLKLIEQATANGKNRAQKMAKNAGEKLGKLVSAKQGVIQITKPNSTRTSSYGIYDLETIKKSVKMVVSLDFEISN